MNMIYIYTYLKRHICTQCAAIVKIKRHPLLLGTSLVCQFGTKRSNMASFESAWLGFGPHDIEVPNLHTYIYIYIWICKENERNLHRAFKGLGKGFPHLPAVSMVYILDTWHPAQPPVPGPTWPHGYFWGPQSGRIHPFFQAPTRWFIYIYNRYLCHCVICISTTCFVKSGGPIPQTKTYPSEDHGI